MGHVGDAMRCCYEQLIQLRNPSTVFGNWGNIVLVFNYFVLVWVTTLWRSSAVLVGVVAQVT
jgi:hypothetical protein